MDSMFHYYLYALLCALGYSLYRQHCSSSARKPESEQTVQEESDAKRLPEFKDFQRKYLIVYLIMMAADWMQGPYVYRLYDYYGFSRQDNGVLFIAGFGSSLVFGTWAGPIADRYGRRLTCLLYGVTYILSCLTKHVNDFNVLMVGRLLGGFATSILWSCFESWMVSEHISRGFNPDWIGSTFSLMFTFNGLVAIGSGFIAQWSVDFLYNGHPVAPFDVSIVFLLIGCAVIMWTWSENYGDQGQPVMAQLKDAATAIHKDRRVAYVGVMQSLFEGAMYTFVFMWTPTLDTPGKPIPHGLIFACFMIACSLGGTVFGIMEPLMKCTRMMQFVFAGAAAAMSTPIFTSSHVLIMGAFIAFEILVGMFWPNIGTLRSKYVPENCRATVINLFRVPLNLMVCMVLFWQGRLNVWMVFVICSLFHLAAFVCSSFLANEEARPTSPENERLAA